MARLISVGFELNSSTSDVEYQLIGGSSTSLTTVSPISGTYSKLLNVNGTLSGNGSASRNQFAAVNTADGFYGRTKFNFTTLPDEQIYIESFDDSGLTRQVSIRMNSDGTLELWNEEDGAQIGSDSSALSTGVTYRIELKCDCTTIGSTAVEAMIDGVSFASGTINLANGVRAFVAGAFSVSGSDFVVHVRTDDIAVNDDSGSFQNSWPGEGSIIHLRPSADGDVSDWTNGWAEVDEVTPDDGTTTLRESTDEEIEDMNIDATPAAIETDSIINVVQVGARFAHSAVSAGDGDFVLRVKSDTGGTVEESAAIAPTTSTYFTNAVAAPRNYALTLYDLPGASTTAWTKATLDTAQIGVRLNTAVGGGNNIRVSTLWALVDYTAEVDTGEITSVAPVVATFSVPAVTATYVYVATASVAPVVATFSVPAVTAAADSGEVAVVSPVVATFSIPTVTPTMRLNAEVSPVTALFTLPEVTPEYSGTVAIDPADDSTIGQLWELLLNSGTGTVQEMLAAYLGQTPLTKASVQEMLCVVNGVTVNSKTVQQILFENLTDPLDLTGGHTQYTEQKLLLLALENGVSASVVVGE
jgi:hypothetical protein